MVDSKELENFIKDSNFDWRIEENKLTAEVSGKNFMSVIELVNKIAGVAEELNHHPDLYIHDYKNLKIILTSHDVGELSNRDIKLAKLIDNFRPL